MSIRYRWGVDSHKCSSYGTSSMLVPLPEVYTVLLPAGLDVVTKNLITSENT
jgi:hypothetical protein